jgi:hypothetical protein
LHAQKVECYDGPFLCPWALSQHMRILAVRTQSSVGTGSVEH